MANINSLSSNSYSSTESIYGNRNVLTGLASGMDTETMIQNSVTGYQTKIKELQKEQTKLEWKQDAYRDLIGQSYNIVQKYTSYTSATNLASNSFFNNAITTSANGTHADAISATGTSKSTIQVNSVSQLATATRYNIAASALDFAATSSPTGSKISWDMQETVGMVNGTITLRYGSNNIDLKFTDEDTFDFEDGDTDEQKMQKLCKAIEEKLGDVDLKIGVGTIKARALINVSVNGNRISFAENDSHPDKSGNKVYISSVSGNITSTLGATKPASTSNADKFANDGFTVSNVNGLVGKPNVAEYISGKTMDITLDGTTKQIKIGDLTGTKISINGEQKSLSEALALMNADSTSDEDRASIEEAVNSAMNTALKNDLQASIDKQFGKNKVTVNIKGGALDFSGSENSMLKASSEVGEKLGIGSGVSNYFNTSSTLKTLLGESWLQENARLKVDPSEITAKTVRSAGMWYEDASGNRVDEEGYRIDDDGNRMFERAQGSITENYTTDEEGNTTGVYYTDSAGQRVSKDGYVLNDDGSSYVAIMGSGAPREVQREEKLEYYDADGNRVTQDGYLMDEKGNAVYGLEINGAKIGGITADTTLESLINKINANADAGVNVSYSNLTREFVFTSRETGEGSDIVFGEGLAQKLFTSDPLQNVTLEKFFGDAVEWNSEGKANMMFVGLDDAASLGSLKKDDTLGSMIETLNSRLDVKIQYQNGKFSLLDKDGKEMSAEKIAEYDFAQRGKESNGNLSFSKLFGSIETGVKEQGQDAIMEATVNGKTISLKRSSNTIEMDGMHVTLKDTFVAEKASDAVTFSSSSDADKIVEAVKTFAEDINKLMTDLHSAFATQRPAKSSSSSKGTTYYEPLTEEDKNSMSESAVKAYEEKAKTGLLFGDSDLSQMYNKLREALTSYGADRMALESIGLTTAYSEGVTTLKVDEKKLREALETDPDKVRTAFTKTKDGGSATNGLMSTLKSTLNTYTSISSGTPGVLVRKAGTRLSSVSLINNNLQSRIDTLNKQISNWQSKLGDKIDYYTKQFTQLEKLMNTMNNQSSMLAGLMGG